MANFSARRSWAEDDYIELELFVDETSYPDALNQGRAEFVRAFKELTADALATDGAGDVE